MWLLLGLALLMNTLLASKAYLVTVIGCWWKN